MNPVFPRTLCKTIDVLGYGMRSKSGVNLKEAMLPSNLSLNFGIMMKGRAG